MQFMAFSLSGHISVPYNVLDLPFDISCFTPLFQKKNSRILLITRQFTLCLKNLNEICILMRSAMFFQSLGGSVTVTGTNFGSVQGGVLMNGKEATINSWTDTSLGLVLPASPPGTYALEISKPGCGTVK